MQITKSESCAYRLFQLACKTGEAEVIRNFSFLLIITNFISWFYSRMCDFHCVENLKNMIGHDTAVSKILEHCLP